VVNNDTGASHLAVAVETPSVTVALGSDTSRWAPLNKALHPTFALKVPCRPCGFQVCPYSHECADIEPTLVARTAQRISNWLPVHYEYSRGVRTAVPA
jgi:ADP-heptose:LPS heptosyltransferase